MYRARSKSPGSALARGSCSNGTRWRINMCLLLVGILLLLVSVVRLQVGLTAIGEGQPLKTRLGAMNYSVSGQVLGRRAVHGGRMLKIDPLGKKHNGDPHRSDDVVMDTEGEGVDADEDGMGRRMSKGGSGGGAVHGGGIAGNKNKLSTSLDGFGDGDVDLRHGKRNGGSFRSLGEVGVEATRKSGDRIDEEEEEEDEEEEEEECSAEEEEEPRLKRRCNGRERAEQLQRWNSRSREGSETAAFSTDDEPVDEETRSRIERILNIEDVLLLNKGSASSLTKNETWGKIEDSKSQKKKGVKDFDPLNPENNPLLQDPDSADAGGLTKNDKLVLKALRFMGREAPPATRVVDRDTETVVHNPMEELDTTVRHRVEGRRKQSLQNEDDETQSEQGDVGSREGISSEREMLSRREARGSQRTDRMVHKLDLSNSVMWGEFPGLHPQLSFSGFIEEFLFDETCSIRVFMAWMSPGWAFTVRHQRVLESLLYFHPNACVVVFSETVELSFFSSFVDDGYRVAVMQPNLQALLDDTASNVFATIWAEWRQVEFFYIHYTELLRLAALYKYGGIYLDWDMIVLKPLDNLKNTIGTELLANGHQRPNGAIMVFDSGSIFLNITMDEFTATYDEKRKEWNGAELLTRVLNAPPDDKYIHLADEDRPHLEPPISFFPLTSSRIVSYFKAPEDEYALMEDLKLLDKILARSYTVHLWNDVTHRLVPESGSLVARLMDKNCIRCDDIL